MATSSSAGLAAKPPPPRFVFPRQDPSKRGRDDREILGEDWTKAYESSATWGSLWQATLGEGEGWPEGIQVWQGKLFRDGRVSVPEGLVTRLLWAQHARTGNFGRRRLVRELQMRFSFPDTVDLWQEVADVRARCRICQACEAENVSLRVPERPQPIIDQFWASVCLDIFDMPEEGCEGQVYDCFLLCGSTDGLDG